MTNNKCKWSSGGANILQMIIGMGEPLANNHLEGRASFKWSLRGTGLLQTIIRRSQPLANPQLRAVVSVGPGHRNRRTRRTCAEDQRKLGRPKSWLTKFSSLDSWGTNNHAIGGWKTKDILEGPKSLETKKLGSSKGLEDQSAEKTNNWKDKKIFNKQMGHRKIKYFIENRD